MDPDDEDDLVPKSLKIPREMLKEIEKAMRFHGHIRFTDFARLAFAAELRRVKREQAEDRGTFGGSEVAALAKSLHHRKGEESRGAGT